MNNIYLTGMMGAGKTVIGEILAQKLKRRFKDLDSLIVEQEGISINEIFGTKGEPYFRQTEKTTLMNVADRDKLIVATGGGIILDEGNRARMKETGTTIYLKVDEEALYKHLCDKDDRPLLKGDSLKKKINDILKAREELYELADVTIESSQMTPEVVADVIIEKEKLSK